MSFDPTFAPPARERGFAPVRPSDEARLRERCARLRVPLPPDESFSVIEARRGTCVLFPVLPAAAGDEDARLVLRGAIGRRLLNRALNEARAAGARRVATHEKIPSGRVEAMLGKEGFERLDRSTVFRIDTGEAEARVGAMAPLLAQRMRDAGMETVSLDEVDPAYVRGALEREQILDGFEFDARAAVKGPGALAMSESVAVRANGQVLGFLMLSKGERARDYVVAARCVLARARTGVVNLLLLTEALGRARRANVQRVSFSANPDRHADTFALAKKLGAEVAGERSRWARDL